MDCEQGKMDRDGGTREACSSGGAEWFDESQCLTQYAFITSNRGTRNGVGFDHLTIAPSFQPNRPGRDARLFDGQHRKEKGDVKRR